MGVEAAPQPMGGASTVNNASNPLVTSRLNAVEADAELTSWNVVPIGRLPMAHGR